METAEGMQVILAEDNIAQVQVDVIVNPTNRDLDLSKGNVAQLVLAGAGAEIQDDLWLKRPQGIAPGDIVISKGYGLPCREVFHGLLPPAGGPGDARSPIDIFVLTCLAETDRRQYSSIAFPLLHDGSSPSPQEHMARRLLQCVFHFSQQHPTSSLVAVFLVASSKEDYEGFQRAFRRPTQPNPTRPVQPTPSDQAPPSRSPPRPRRVPLRREVQMRQTTIEEERALWLGMDVIRKRRHYVCGKKEYVSAMDDSKVFPWLFYYCVHDLQPEPTAEWTVDEELNSKIALWRGDITKLEMDAVVNAAKPRLSGGDSGVNGAIHKGAGPLLREECATHDECGVGKAILTAGYRLPATFVIHTVGPKQEDSASLTQCYLSCLEVALAHSIRSIAFPTISGRVYSHNSKRATRVAIKAVRRFLEEHRNDLDRVVFCVHDADILDAYEALLPKYFPVEYGHHIPKMYF